MSKKNILGLIVVLGNHEDEMYKVCWFLAPVSEC